MTPPKSRSSARILGVFALASALLSGSLADAGTLLLSADSSIIEGLLGGGTIPLTAGNATFFNNARGGGNNVEILSTALNSTTGTPSQLSNLNTFYNSQAGVTSSIVTGPITTALLGNTNLFIDDLPDAALTASEVVAVKAFMARGGTFFLLTEAATVSGFGPSIAAAGADLTLLGSSMKLTGDSLDALGHTASVANGQVLPGPYTAGVTTFGYAFTNGITGGQAQFLTTNKTAFISYEATSSAVPEPASILMVSMALAGVALARGRARAAGGRRPA